VAASFLFVPPNAPDPSPTNAQTTNHTRQNTQTQPPKTKKQDAFFARVGKQSVIQGAGLPAAAVGFKKVVSGTPGLEELANVPLAVLAPLLGTFAQSVRALVPI
jgi:hypothetical protein